MNKRIYYCLTASLLFLLVGCQTLTNTGWLSPAVSDEALTANAQHALYQQDDPLIANLRAESIEGRVVLTGYVKKISQSDEAESIVSRVPGVKSVENKIIVRQ